MRGHRSHRLAGAVLLALVVPIQAGAAAECEPVVGRVAAVEGTAELQRTGTSRWQTANPQDVLCQGDTVRSGAKSRMALALINDAVLRLDELTTLRLVDIVPEPEEESILDHIKGLFASFSRQPRTMAINTAYLNGAIEGTEFVVRTDEQRSTITVLEGLVRASNDQGSIQVAQGEAASAEAGQAPQLRTVVRPRDAVQWSLHYPPILTFLGGASGGVPGDVPSQLRSALQAAADSDIGAAYAELENVAEADRDADFYLYRAALGLSVGRVDEAQSDIQQALRLDSNAGLAYSLRAIIEIVQNETQAALASAQRGVELSDTAAARIALSYAQQANFRIEPARDTLQGAVEQHPDDALAWARLGEVWLMLGNSEESRAAAQQAAELAPDLARTQLVLGYAALAEFRNTEARAAFERAIELSSSDPLAHLGLGLARISSGDLEAGRQDLEVAVGLDANTALLRSYLGKAYFEEKRHPLDSQQYSIAKQLDPNDPTAYLYDGILKQTVNRPVEAVADLEKSIELNDNRAVYRSRLLLDKDRAARGTSLARAYNDLGFKQLGLNEATQSLSLDASNYSAHRFLSDTYLGVRRFERARVSELLQAQLMQDVNINPVQPSISETNLNVVTLGGPASPGFNEFTPLFQRNRTQFNATGFGGNNDTYGGEAVVSGLYDKISYSVGAFTYNTDGWRPNNDLEQDLYSVYVQGAVSPTLNLQAEFRHRESNQGDLAFNFDPNDFLADSRRDKEQDIGRVGLRYSPSQSSSLLVSYTYSERDDGLKETDTLDPFTDISIDVQSTTEGHQPEVQYIHLQDRWNLVLGVGYSKTDVTDDQNVVITDINFGPVFNLMDTTTSEAEQPRGYAYANINLTDAITWTVGASYDEYTQDPVDESSFNPKLGIQWRPTENLLVRAAALKVLTPALINNRTIEPTQVAGFNQFFDDLNGSKSERYGVGIDWRPTQTLAIGGQVTWRNLDEPTISIDQFGNEEAIFENVDEQYHDIYLYWTPSERIGVTTKLVYDRYDREEGMRTELGEIPVKVDTVTVPVAATYFHPNGLFATVSGSYVDQEVRRQLAAFPQGDDSFFVADIAVGYRFPNRKGRVSLGIKNVFDEEFRYQDDSFREFADEPSIGPYFPERIVMGYLTLSF